MKKNLFSLRDLSNDEIMEILEEARRFKRGKEYPIKNKIVCNLFFEPSTRTQYSFNMAEEKLDMKVINFNAQTSSLNKGESFYDTIKTFESFGIDLFVIRHSKTRYYDELKNINIPIINAGDGMGDHPTQSLLDLFTIYEEYGHFDGLKIAICGDIKHSRVAHTNIEVMTRLGMECYTTGPKEYEEAQYNHIPFDKAIKEMDIIMLLRIQNERLGSSEHLQISNDEYLKNYGLTMDKVEKMKDTAIIMHPAPFNRGVEIADDVVECNKSRIFKQMTNGVYIRMAVVKRSLGL